MCSQQKRFLEKQWVFLKSSHVPGSIDLMICPYFSAKSQTLRFPKFLSWFWPHPMLRSFTMFYRSLLFHEVDEWLVAAEITPQGAIHIDPWHWEIWLVSLLGQKFNGFARLYFLEISIPAKFKDRFLEQYFGFLKKNWGNASKQLKKTTFPSH